MNHFNLLVFLTIAFLCSTTTHAQFTLAGNVLSTTNLVGIGTTSPLNNLDVRGGITATGSIECNGGDIYISRHDDPNQGYGYVVRPDIAGFRNLQFACAAGAQLDNLAFNSKATFTSGKFGVCNPGPVGQLDVYSPGTGNMQQVLLLHTGTFGTGTNAQASYFIKAVDDGSTTTQFIVHGDGAVGIRSDAISGYALSVNGSGIFTKLVVKTNISADYVFDSTYALPSLGKVEQYIKENHHLPEIPSADSMVKAGINVGDNQVALLKKVEELTLYMIQMNETVQQQQEKIRQLEDRLNKRSKKNK